MARRRHLSPAIAAPVLYGVYRALCATLRFREWNRQPIDELDARQERMVFCLWHDELFPLMQVQRQLDIVTLVSPSRDGELLARVLELLGLRTVRGSSTRGGAAALVGAARLMREDAIHACITIDGPQGPRHKAKDGALFLAHHADAHIVPVRLRLQPSFKVKSWDRFQVPLPFGAVSIYFADPWKLDAVDLDETAMALARQRLEDDLHRLGEGWERSA